MTHSSSMGETVMEGLAAEEVRPAMVMMGEAVGEQPKLHQSLLALLPKAMSIKTQGP